MIILFHASGNHSNRLFQSIHFEAFCKENNIKFSTLCFENMKDLYGIKRNYFANIRRYFIVLLYKLHLLKAYRFGEESDTQKYENELLLNKKNYVFGWGFRRHDLTKKYRADFQKKYKLQEKYIEKNEFIKQSLSKSDNEVLVGIHIRRGDYRHWQGGKYYFENDAFDIYMKRMTDLLAKEGKTVKFILFSNEVLEYKESDTLFISHEQWYIDQYIMSKCDFLIGPPSTFTSWASYIGEVPVLFMNREKMNFSMDEFKIIEG